MSDENRFFRFMWRLNAFVVLLAGIAITYAVTKDQIGWDKFENYVGPIVKMAPEKPAVITPKVFYYLSALDVGYQNIANSYLPGQNRRPWLMATDSDSERLLALMRSSYDSSAGPEATLSYDPAMQPVQVNFLAVDGATGEGHWVFSGFDRIITKYEVLTDMPKDPANAAAMTAVVIQTVDADTNKDGKRDGLDRQTLYVYRPGDKDAVKLLSADVIVDQGITRNSTYLITYENGEVRKAAIYSSPEFKLLSEKTLPKLPQ